MSTMRVYLRQNGILTWIVIETAIMIQAVIWMKYKTRSNLTILCSPTRIHWLNDKVKVIS